MSTPTLIVKDSSGNTKATLDCQSVQRTDPRGKMSRAQATVLRDAWRNLDIDGRTDELTIERGDGSLFFGGRFDDDRYGDLTVTVTAVSFERDALNAEPTSRSLLLENTTDNTVLTQYVVDAVDTLSTGNIDTIVTGLSWNFPNSARSKVARKVQVASGGALKYRPDGSLDYVDRLGSDRSLVISRDSGVISSDPRVQIDARDEVTHIRGYGSREGNVTATAVASSYNGGPPVYREYEDTDIQSQDRLQQVIDRLVNEYDGERTEITVEPDLYGPDTVKRGDSFKVELPRRGIDRRLTVETNREIIDDSGRHWRPTLTNRIVDDAQNGNPRESLQRFNRGYQGFVDRNQVNSGWNPAGDTVPQTLEIPNWPDDIEREDLVELTVQGRAWRSPIDATGVTSASNSDYSTVTTTEQADFFIDLEENTFKEMANITISDPTSAVRAFVSMDAVDNASEVKVRLRNKSTGYAFPTSSPNSIILSDSDDYHVTFVGVDPTDCDGDDLALEISTPAAGDAGKTIHYTSLMWAEGKHTHTIPDSTVQPAIIDTFNGNQYYPTDVEVVVNGSTITTLSGDSTQDWQETVDLSGQLTPGQNTITATPTGQRGSLNLILASELFRRGGT